MKSRILTAAAFLMFFMGESAYAQYHAYLAQVANGSFGDVSFATTLIFFNNSDTAVTATLKLTDDAGNPLVVTITGLGTNSQFSIPLDPGATELLQTDGHGSGAVGAASVSSPTPIGVSAVFTLFDAHGSFMTEAGVGSSELLSDFLLPVDSVGSFLTGLALYCPAGNASITLTLFNTDGSQAGTAPLTLGTGAHTARFVAAAGQLFPTIINFRGTLRVQSSSPIAALVLRQYQASSQLTYTSLPVVNKSSSKLALNLAQIVNGSSGGVGYKTSFLIFSTSSVPAHVSMNLSQDNGSPFSVTIPGTGPGTGTNSSFNFTLAPEASVFLQTDGLGTVTSGAATITSDVPLGASAIFTIFNSQGLFETEAGVGDSPVSTSMTLPVDITGTFDTGVALFNPGGVSATLTFKLLDSTGTIKGTRSQPLAPHNHLAIFVDQLFPGTANFTGSLAISASVAVAATTLRQDTPSASLLTFTSLPTSPGTATGKTVIPALLAKIESGISATGNLIKNVALPSGFRISGTITGPGFAGYAVARDGVNSFSSNSLGVQGGRYVIVVPAGTYNLSVSFVPAGLPSGGSVNMTYTDPNPVQVSADAVRGITLPAPTLRDVSGVVSNLGTLTPGPGSYITFTSTDLMSQGIFKYDAGGNFQGKLPEGNFVAGFVSSRIQFTPIQSETLVVYNLGSLVVGSGPAIGTYSIPPLSKVSGTINTSALTGVLFAPLSALDTSASQTPQIGLQSISATSSISLDTSSGLYQAILVQNRTYNMSVGVNLNLGTGKTGAISYPVPPSVLNLTADVVFNLSFSGLPAQVTISGQVVDPEGKGVAGAQVYASSRSINGAPNLSYSTSAKADANGNYTMVALSGDNYQITYVPPTPTS